MSEPKPESPESRFRPPHLLYALGAVVLLGAALLGYGPLHYHLTHVVTDDAYVSGTLVPVATSVSGRIIALAVKEGDTVAQKQKIAHLHDSTYRAEVAFAKASVAAARSRLAEASIELEQEQRRAGPLVEKEEADLVACRSTGGV